MSNPRATAAKLAADFSKLNATHRRIVKVLLDAMAPEVKQRTRDELRQAFAAYSAEAATDSNDSGGA